MSLELCSIIFPLLFLIIVERWNDICTGFRVHLRYLPQSGGLIAPEQRA